MNPLLLLTLLVAGFAFVSWYQGAPPALRKRIATRAVITVVGAALLLGLLTGRLNPLIAGIAALVPLGYRALGALRVASAVNAFRNQFKAGQGPTPGRSSEVETRFVRMRLDHDTGAMDGEVLDGAHRGRRLGELGLADLVALLERWRREDAQSAAVLEAYLDRMHGDEWREHARAGGPGRARRASSAMSREEAREVLGVGPEADKAEIVAAHRRLMQKLHPDRGGTTYLAAKLNEAKEVLLGA